MKTQRRWTRLRALISFLALCVALFVNTTMYGFDELNSFPRNPRFPNARLVQGSDGNFYGTTEKSGANTYGTVFKMTPAGVLTTLVTFNTTNGSNPYAGLV